MRRLGFLASLVYDAVPTASAHSLIDALDALQPGLAKIRCPVLILTSPQDHVVAPEQMYWTMQRWHTGSLPPQVLSRIRGWADTRWAVASVA